MKVMMQGKLQKGEGWGKKVREEEKHNPGDNYLQSAALQLNNDPNPEELWHI